MSRTETTQYIQQSDINTNLQLINTDKYLLLRDDKHFWPPYNLAPIVRDDVLKSNPKIESTLNKISKKLDYRKPNSFYF